MEARVASARTDHSAEGVAALLLGVYSKQVPVAAGGRSFYIVGPAEQHP
jgi:hypothetical protein